MRKYINLQGQPKRKRALLRSNPPGIGSDGRKCIGRNSKLTSFDFDYSFHFPNFIKYIFVPKCLKKPICKSSKMKFLNLPVYTVKLTLSKPAIRNIYNIPAFLIDCIKVKGACNMPVYAVNKIYFQFSTMVIISYKSFVLPSE
jgi:hypothetical protein